MLRSTCETLDPLATAKRNQWATRPGTSGVRIVSALSGGPLELTQFTNVFTDPSRNREPQGIFRGYAPCMEDHADQLGCQGGQCGISSSPGQGFRPAAPKKRWNTAPASWNTAHSSSEAVVITLCFLWLTTCPDGSAQPTSRAIEDAKNTQTEATQSAVLRQTCTSTPTSRLRSEICVSRATKNSASVEQASKSAPWSSSISTAVILERFTA